jgi:hypothetical protein
MRCACSSIAASLEQQHLRDQAYRTKVIDDVYVDENGFICESIPLEPLQLQVKASASESGHLLVADVKPRASILAWLIMIYVL